MAGTRLAATRSSTPTAWSARSSSPTPTRSPAAPRPPSAPASAPAATRRASCCSPGARAHNRWLAELCQDSPERRAGVAIVPIMVDIDAAVAEIRRAHASGLRGGILIPPMWQPHEPYHHPRYDPVWAVCEELSMPVHVHSGVADRAAVRSARRHLHHRDPVLVVASAAGSSSGPGVFERFPGLRFGVAECGAFWVNDLLWRMDLVYERDHGSRKLGERADGEHVDAPERVLRPQLLHRRVEHHPGRDGPPLRDRRRQPLLGQRLPASRRAPGPTRGSSWPTCSATSRATRPRPSSGGNAAEVYGFDVEALRPLVERIGPTPEELGQDDDPTAKWADAKRAGRPWLTGIETWPTATPAVVTTTTGSRRRSIRSTRLTSSRRTSRTPRLRDEDPVHWSELLSGWVVTRFDDVAAILRDPSMSSDIHKATPNPIDRLEMEGLAEHGQATQTIVHLDDPDHARVRKLMAEPFRVREVSRLRVADRAAGRPTRSTGCATSTATGTIDARPDRRPRLSAAGRDLLGVAGRARGGQPAVPLLDELGGAQPRPDEPPRSATSSSRRSAACTSTWPSRPR